MTTRMVRLAIASLLAAAMPAPTLAQSATLPSLIGERVRITTSSVDRPVIGVVQSQESGQLDMRLDGGELASVPVDDITRAQRSLGYRSHTGTGALAGALIGGLGGIGMGIYVANAICGSCDSTASDAMLIGGLYGAVGALGGTLVGALLGSAMSTEGWDEISGTDRRAPVQVMVAPDMHGGIAIGLEIPIR